MQGRYRQVQILLLAAVACAVLSLGFTRVGRRLGGAVMRPLVSVWSFCTEICGDIWSRFSPEPRRQRENLERELREAQTQLLAQQELEEQNRQLRALLNLDAPPKWHGVAAEVQSRDPARWNWEFIIDKGSSDGLAVGNPVLFGQSMVGRIIEVNQHTATVATIGHKEMQFAVTIRHGETYYNGIYHGSSSALDEDSFRSHVDFLPKETTVAPGDGIFTTGYGGLLPPALPVGTVAPQTPCPELVDNARARVLVRPNASFADLRFVVVLVHQISN